MGKAIRNFKDSISGVEEAKFRRLQQEQKEEDEKRATAALQVQPPLSQTPPLAANTTQNAPSSNETPV